MILILGMKDPGQEKDCKKTGNPEPEGDEKGKNDQACGEQKDNKEHRRRPRRDQDVAQK